jgi:hypothetical protein
MINGKLINVIILLLLLLEQATKAHRGVEVQLYSFFNLGAKWGWVVKATPRPFYPQARDSVPIV